jgi:predicted permease
MASILFDILGPVFLIVAVGAWAGRTLDLQPATLSKLSYWILGPAFIFNVFGDANLELGLIGRMAASGLVAMAVTALITVAMMRVTRRSRPSTAASIMTSVYGNVGNFGLAIVAFTYGEDALPLAGVMFIVINIGGLIVGVTAASGQRASPAIAVRTALMAPMTLAVPPALVVNAFDVEVPLLIERPISLISGALIPVMLLTLGAQLVAMTRPRIGPELSVPVGTKLVLNPLAAAAATTLFGLTGVPAGVVVLQSAMPAAVFTAMVAIEHDLEPTLVTTTVLVGSIASIASLPVVIALLI